jgi:cystathionine beta-lyase
VLFPTYDDLQHRRGRFDYGTSGTPTTESLTQAWSELAGAAGTVLTPSGLAALTVALMAVVSAGRRSR